MLNTRSFIPHRVHASIGVLAAVSVATACLLPKSTASDLAIIPLDGRFGIEHPSGATEVFLDIAADGSIMGAGNVRTARKLFDGRVFPLAPDDQPKIVPLAQPAKDIGLQG